MTNDLQWLGIQVWKAFEQQHFFITFSDHIVQKCYHYIPHILPHSSTVTLSMHLHQILANYLTFKDELLFSAHTFTNIIIFFCFLPPARPHCHCHLQPPTNNCSVFQDHQLPSNTNTERQPHPAGLYSTTDAELVPSSTGTSPILLLQQ